MRQEKIMAQKFCVANFYSQIFFGTIIFVTILFFGIIFWPIKKSSFLLPKTILVLSVQVNKVVNLYVIFYI